ncbi:hypothetical protein [Ectopseudomonas toyotomiensis]|uniref:hypothetical protein n=1 Tax=Ectopseudomonas toyotomiensis TaxID=554344 RepID=UPI003D0B7BED
MAGTQRQNTSVGHRLGYGLGQMVKRVRAAWFSMESNLIGRAGDRAPLVKAGLLVMKIVLGVAGLVAVLFAAFWLAAFVLGVFALITFGGRHDEDDSSLLYTPDGYEADGFYVNGMKAYDYDE